MRKIGYLNNSVNDPAAVWGSLSAIKDAHIQLRHLTGPRASPSALAWQIELCEVLLVEISGIRSSLAEDLKQTRRPSQRRAMLD